MHNTMDIHNWTGIVPARRGQSLTPDETEQVQSGPGANSNFGQEDWDDIIISWNMDFKKDGELFQLTATAGDLEASRNHAAVSSAPEDEPPISTCLQIIVSVGC